MMERSILVIHTDGNPYNNPTLKCVIDLFRANNIGIDIHFPPSRAPMPSHRGVASYPWPKWLAKIKRFVYDNISSWWAAWFIVRVESLFIHPSQYSLVIAVDRYGLIEASILHSIYGVPYIYISFEIMFEEETSWRYKRLERLASRQLRFFIVQDFLREQCLKTENMITSAQSLLIPLASSGLGEQLPTRLRDKLQIPLSKNVAILMGSLYKWTMAEEIIENSLMWPNDWVLIVHDRYGNTAESIEKLSPRCQLAINSGKVYCSYTASDEVDQMGEILSGIAVGLAFYRPSSNHRYTGKNLQNLGLASGKIATYLRYSVPVVMNDIGLYSKLAESYNFGITCESISSIPLALSSTDWTSKAVSAKDFFLEHLDFEKYKHKLCSILNSTSNELYNLI